MKIYRGRGTAFGLVALSFTMGVSSIANAAAVVPAADRTVFAGASALLSSYISMAEGVSLKEDADEAVRLFSLTGDLPTDDGMIDLTAPVDLEIDPTVATEYTEDSDNTGVSEEAEPEVAEVVDYGYINLGVARVENYLNVRKDSSINAELAGKMPAGAGCEVLEEDGDWFKVKSGKVEGYVSAEYLATGDEAYELAAEYVRTVATVNTEALRVREEPNTECTIDTLVSEGEELIVMEDMGDWIKVDMDDYEAYVAAEYVEVSDKLPHAITIKELNYGTGVSDVRVDLVQYALQFVGNRYVWGGTSLTNGVDCSGFTMKILGRYGVSLPHSSRSQSGMGKKVNGDTIQPGDLVFYGTGGSVNHVAIYIGNGQIVHASNKRDGIKISNMYYRNPITMRSFL